MTGPFFVDYDKGRDSNDGLPTGAPKKTLQAGISLVTAASETAYATLGGAAKETGVLGRCVDYLSSKLNTILGIAVNPTEG